MYIFNLKISQNDDFAERPLGLANWQRVQRNDLLPQVCTSTQEESSCKLGNAVYSDEIPTLRISDPNSVMNFIFFTKSGLPISM